MALYSQVPFLKMKCTENAKSTIKNTLKSAKKKKNTEKNITKEKNGRRERNILWGSIVKKTVPEKEISGKS